MAMVKFGTTWADLESIEFVQQIAPSELEIGMKSGRTFRMQGNLETLEPFYLAKMAEIETAQGTP